MKKGFTLIEIILTLALVLIVGTSATVFISKSNNNDKNLEKLTKEILEAANAYIKIEKDNNGNIYANKIINGKKGIKVPVSNLVDKGYIEEEQEKQLYKLNNETKEEDKSYYIMFIEDTNNYCDDGSYITVSSWMDEGNDVYLCDNPIQLQTEEKNITTKFIADLDKFAVSKTFYDNLEITEEEKNKLYTYEENGIYVYFNETSKNLYYYYRGAIESNYLKFGTYTDENGNTKDLIWRILWYNNKQQMKLVLAEDIPLYITSITNKVVELNKTNKTLYSYQMSSGTINFIDYTSEVDIDHERRNRDYTYSVNESDVFSNFISLEYDMYDEQNFYYQELKKWYNKTNLSSSSLITKNSNFCVNTANEYERDKSTSDDAPGKYITEEYNYKPSENFECSYDSYYSSLKSSPVGFLTYGEAIRAGLSRKSVSNTSLVNSGNYLISSNDEILLPDLKWKENEKNSSTKLYRFDINQYYISSSGLSSRLIYSKTRDEDSDLVYHDKTWLNTYKIKVSNGNEYGAEHGDSFYIAESDLICGSIKPTIVLNLTNQKLSDASGTKGDEYTVVGSSI